LESSSLERHSSALLLGCSRASYSDESTLVKPGQPSRLSHFQPKPHAQTTIHPCKQTKPHPKQGPDPSRGLLLLYEGEFLKGQWHGQGTAHYRASGEKYIGRFAAGQRHGQGRLEFANGDVYEGTWRRGRRHGAGRLTSAAGDVFVGTFVMDRRQGLGTVYMVRKGGCVSCVGLTAGLGELLAFCILT